MPASVLGATGGACSGRAATVLAISCTVAAPAASEQLPLARFTLADGLAGDLVTHLYQDRTGFLWIGTQSGLSRFDGQRFVSYDTRHGLPDAVVRQVLETADGRLWVATRGGLARLEPRAEDDAARFRAWTFGPGLEHSVAGLVEDSHGRLWLGSGDRVLRVLEEKGEVHFRRLPLEVEFAEPHGRVRTIVEGPDASLWIATRAGVVRVLPDGGQRPYPLDDPRRLRFDADGTLWVTLARRDVLALRPEPAEDDTSGSDWAARYAAARTDPDPGCRVREVGDLCLYTHPDPLPLTQVLDILPEGSGVWIAGDDGLVRFDGEAFRRVGADQPELRAPFEAVLRDAAGSLWLGTGTRGLVRLSLGGVVSFREADGLHSGYVVQVLDAPRDEVAAVTWTADQSYWLHLLTPQGRFRTLRPRGLEAAWNGRGGGSRHQCVLRDHRGEWWFASEGDAIYRYPAVERVEELATTTPLARYTVEDGLPGDEFFRIYEDANGDIWFGILGVGGTVTFWERSTGRFRTLGAASGLPGAPRREGTPTAFAEDAAGRLWMGFYYGGVARARDSRNRSFDFFDEAAGVPAGFVDDLLADSRGRMWIAQTDAVLRVEQPQAPRPHFERLAAAEALFAGRGCCLAEDRFGRVYVGTQRGVVRLPPEGRGWSRLTTVDGLASNLLRTLHRAANGDLWLGTRNGLSRLIPRAEGPASPPRVRIDEVRVAGEPWPSPELGATTLGGLTLEPAERRLTVGYFALALEPGETLRYQYRLRRVAGITSGGGNPRHSDVAWSAPTAERSVTFEALPADDFIFEVRAIRADGTVSLAPATLAFERLPPVWQRGWFAALVGTFLALLIWGLVAVRQGRRRALDRQRERIARDLHDQLGSGLGSIGLVAELLAEEEATRPERRDAAAEIAAAARELGGSLSDIVWALDPQVLSLEELLARLAQRGAALLSGHDTDLVCRFPESWPDARPSPAVRRSVLLIGLEALHNAARHAGARRVELVAEPAAARRWRLFVRDDGRGLPFGADRRRDVGRHVGRERRRRGRGMANMRRRAEEIGAAIAWRRTSGGGTTVELVFPLRHPSRRRRRPA